MRALVVISSIFVVGCSSVNQDSLKNNNKSALINKDRIIKIDSLKWILDFEI
jgi:hypothetical protein